MALRQVDERIVPPQMGQFVCDERLEQDRIESRGERGWQQDHRAEDANNDRNGRASAPGDQGNGFESDSLHLPQDDFGERPFVDRHGRAPQPPTAPQGDEQAGEHGQDADEIRTHDESRRPIDSAGARAGCH